MFVHLLESSHRDDSNKLSNIGFGEEIEVIEIKMHILSVALIEPKKLYKDFLTHSILASPKGVGKIML